MAKRKKEPKESFPPFLYVSRERDGDDSYFVASEEISGEEGDLVGIYELQGTGTVKVPPKELRQFTWVLGNSKERE